MIGPRILVNPDSPVVGCAAPSGLVRGPLGSWRVVSHGRTVAVFAGLGAKAKAIQANGGSNAVIT